MMSSLASTQLASTQLDSLPLKPRAFEEPRRVAIFHDLREVVRIEDGVISNLVETSEPQESLEIYWDGTLVYRLVLQDGGEHGTVLINTMSEYFQP